MRKGNFQGGIANIGRELISAKYRWTYNSTKHLSGGCSVDISHPETSSHERDKFIVITSY